MLLMLYVYPPNILSCHDMKQLWALENKLRYFAKFIVGVIKIYLYPPQYLENVIFRKQGVERSLIPIQIFISGIYH